MWFDPFAKLEEIAGQPPATSATSATNTPTTPSVSQLSRESQALGAEKRNFGLQAASQKSSSPAKRHLDDAMVTWTGRVVPFGHWAGLSDWERHGPNGRHWCGICKDWHFSGQCGAKHD